MLAGVGCRVPRTSEPITMPVFPGTDLLPLLLMVVQEVGPLLYLGSASR